MTRPVVLVVDDEAPMRKYVAANLHARGYDVLAAADGAEALKVIAERPIDLVILDIGMPGPDGLAVLRAIRRDMEIPVLMLSARGRERDKVEALDQGADDYLTKPFGVEELLARVRAALRRATSAPVGSTTPYRYEDLEVDFGTRSVRMGGQVVPFTPKEFAVLAYLARNAGKVLSHRQILQAVWGGEYTTENDYVWTYVRRIREKIEPDQGQPRYVLTRTGFGYGMPPATDVPPAKDGAGPTLDPE